MLTKSLATMMITMAVLALIGCGKKNYDRRLMEIAVKVEKQEAAFDRIDRKIDAIESSLGEIQESLQEITRVPSGTAPAGTAEHKTLDFRNMPEYGNMAAALSAIQQQLGLTQNDLAETKKEIERERRRDPGRQWQALQDPEEMKTRLDALAESFAQQIDDPIRRQNFEAEIERWKQINLDSLSTQELSELLASDLTRRWNDTQDKDTRSWIERQLQEFESARTGDLDAAVAAIRADANFRHLEEVAKRHGIPSEALTDAGLPDPNQALSFVSIEEPEMEQDKARGIEPAFPYPKQRTEDNGIAPAKKTDHIGGDGQQKPNHKGPQKGPLKTVAHLDGRADEPHHKDE